MNITNIDHFKTYFPEVELGEFTHIYFSQGAKDSVAFVAVKGKMEDFRFYTKGEYDEESLERRLFSLAAKYSPPQDYGINNLGWDEDDVREEMVSSIKAKTWIGEGVRTLAFILILTVLQFVTLFLAWVLGMAMGYVLAVGSILLLVNIVLLAILLNIRRSIKSTKS